MFVMPHLWFYQQSCTLHDHIAATRWLTPTSPGLDPQCVWCSICVMQLLHACRDTHDSRLTDSAALSVASTGVAFPLRRQLRPDHQHQRR